MFQDPAKLQATATASRASFGLAKLKAQIARLPHMHVSSAGAFAVLVVGAGISYLAQVATARILGADSFGIYAYAFSWTTLLAYISTLGFHVSLLRLAPTYLARNELSHLRGLLLFAALGTLATGLAISTALLGLFLYFEGPSGELRNTLLIGLAAAPLLALQLVGAATARAFGSVVAALAPERLGRDLIAIILLAGLVWSNLAPAQATVAMVAMLGSAMLILWLAIRLVRKVSSPVLDFGPAEFAPKDWIRPALPLTLIMLADVVMGRSGVVVLGLIGEIRSAGVFAAVFAMATLVSLPRMAVAAAFAPTVADLYARGDRAGLQALSARAARLSLAGAILVAVPLLAFAPQLLTLFGPYFAIGSTAVFLLVAGHLVAAAAGPQQHILTMTGREPDAAKLQGAAALCGVGLCFALAPNYGVTGTAAALAGATILWNLGMAWVVWSRLGIRPGLLARTHRTMTDE